MLSLRLSGLPYKDLANHYKADKSSIKVWCRRFEIVPKSTTSVRFVAVFTPNPPIKQYKYQASFDDNDTTNQGKSYLRYLVESRRNYIRSLYDRRTETRR